MFDTFKFTNDHIAQHGFPLGNYIVPEGKEGKFEIKHVHHKAGETLEIINMRMAIMAGLRPAKIRLEYPWTEIRLIEHKEGVSTGVWMSTHPIETYSQLYPVLKAHGDVLVGGLGLGYVVQGMLQNKAVKSITVVEKQEAVLDLVCGTLEELAKGTGIEVSLIHGDIKKHLKAKNCPVYDFIYLDTWAATSESEFLHTVLPLRELAGKRLSNGFDPAFRKKNIVCWMGEIMRGQFINGFMSYQSLTGLAKVYATVKQLDKNGKIYYDPFIKFCNKYGIKKLQAMPHEKYGETVIGFMENYKI